MGLILGVAALAVLAWWGSTGLIVLAVRQFEERRGIVLVGAAVLAAFGVAAILLSAEHRSPPAAILAFIGALVVWGFFEVSFLLGWITGPRREACPPHCTPFERFKAAAATVIHHELALFATLAVLGVMLADAGNQVALVTFCLLWIMRLASKFILFLGARHSFSDLMPKRLAYLQTYFRTDRTTSLGLVALGFILTALAGESEPFMIAANTLAATFLGLALAELVLLNVPLRDSALWQWALARQA
jgi:putative photosynthetic complex assembly protein 2